MEENTAIQAVTEIKTTVTIGHRALAFMMIDDEARIDSRELATGIGIEHESLVKTLRTYQERLEQLGSLRFEIGVKSNNRGGEPPKYALLTRSQAMFAITLSRNTEQVVDFKFDLIRAFDYLLSLQSRKQPARLSRGTKGRPSIGTLTDEELDQRIIYLVERNQDKGVALSPSYLHCTHLKSKASTAILAERMKALAERGVLVTIESPHTIHYRLPSKK